MPKVTASTTLRNGDPLPSSVDGVHNCGTKGGVSPPRTTSSPDNAVRILGIVCTPTITAYLVDDEGSVVRGGISSQAVSVDGTWKIEIDSGVIAGTYTLVVIITCTCRDEDTGTVDRETQAIVTVTGLTKP
jgi:hypothetical protein